MIIFECNEITKYLSTSDFTLQILWMKRYQTYGRSLHREDGYATNTTRFYIWGTEVRFLVRFLEIAVNKNTIKHKQDII